jgi:hypothetical protein
VDDGSQRLRQLSDPVHGELIGRRAVGAGSQLGL